VPKIDTDPDRPDLDRRALVAYSDPDPAKRCGSVRIRIRIHNHEINTVHKIVGAALDLLISFIIMFPLPREDRIFSSRHVDKLNINK
jgi:hypothetical protein